MRPRVAGVKTNDMTTNLTCQGGPVPRAAAPDFDRAMAAALAGDDFTF
jgi:hypothetical protein